MARGRNCRPCDMVWGGIGLIGGMVLLYIGIDLLTNGAITALITGAASAEPEELELEGEEATDE